MKCATAAEMRAMDQRAVHAHGISETELMQRAAQAMLDALCAHYGRTCRYGIFCGCGNNGGDGYALGELMADAGMSLTICARDGQLSPGAAVYAERAAEKGVRIAGMDQADEVIADSDVLVDALFGTGISREMSGADAALADRLNESGKPVAAVDIPSGMHADGEWMSAHTVKAELTVTFVCLKEAMLKLPQREWCGKIEVRPIGMPPAAVQCADTAIVLDDERVRAMLPRRMPHSHKGTYGRVLLIAGSLNMSGAPRLCAQAILRAGAGLLTCMIPAGIHDIVASAIPEAMYRPLAMDENGQIAVSALPQSEQLRGFDLIVIGNGMGRGSSTRAAVQLVLDSGVPCILDGDALYEAGMHGLLPTHRDSALIVTPHLRELEYLSGIPLSQISRDPRQCALTLAQRYPYLCIAAKDDFTWIVQESRQAVNITGNDGLAKGGSGDVLCGIIAGLYAQGRQAFESACAGVYLHAAAARHLAAHCDTMSILPHELSECLGSVCASLRRQRP